MTHTQLHKDVMDTMVLNVIKAHPGRRLSDIHYDPGTPGMGETDVRSSLRRLTRQGKVRRTLCGHGWFRYYRYYPLTGEKS